jgi:hypothetical protein
MLKQNYYRNFYFKNKNRKYKNSSEWRDHMAAKEYFYPAPQPKNPEYD